MKIPMEWLKEYVPVRLKPEELAHKLTMAGLEVVGIERTADGAVLDLEITPNRADCLSMIGVAREVAAITGQRVKSPWTQDSRRKTHGKRSRVSGLGSRVPFKVRIEDSTGCQRYIGRLLESVRVGSSPEWMQRRLEACGLRPINNVVDITNYVLLEWGQPLHAFDADRLEGLTVAVRRAKAGETLVTLDGQARALAPEMLVIADARRPVAIAGVMGGRDTQVTPSTRRIVLESAYFEPLTVRRTGRQLRLASESSYRFERGVDPDGVERASQRASQLIQELAGGTERAVADAGKALQVASAITLSQDRLSSRLGVTIPPATVTKSLQSLGCSVRRSGGGWRVRPPSFRRDLRHEVDLSEELARLWGYEHVPHALPEASLDAPRYADSSYARAQRVKTFCAGLGLSEAVTWALVSAPELAEAGFSSGLVEVANPLSRDHAVLRPTLVVGLLRAAAKNLSQGAPTVRLFELGQVFTGNGRAQERPYLGFALAGAWERSWQGSVPAGLFRLKGVVEQMAARFARAPLRAEAASLPWAEPGQGIRLWLGERPVGAIGEVTRRLRESYDCERPIWVGEIEAEALLLPEPADRRAEEVSHFPPVKRDLSFVVDRKVAFGDLIDAIRSTGAPLASDIELIDRYAGKNIPDSKHSLTFSIDYRNPARTLTAEEVDRVHARIVSALTARFGIQLR